MAKSSNNKYELMEHGPGAAESTAAVAEATQEEDITLKLNKQTKVIFDHLDKFMVVMRPLTAFVAGGLIGALFMEHLDFYSFVFPIAVIAVFIYELKWKLVTERVDSGLSSV